MPECLNADDPPELAALQPLSHSAALPLNQSNMRADIGLALGDLARITLARSQAQVMSKTMLKAMAGRSTGSDSASMNLGLSASSSARARSPSVA
jgi:hypothetical protein